jgi:hypothetical protein
VGSPVAASSSGCFHQAEVDYLTVINFQLFGSKTFAVARNLVEHLAHFQSAGVRGRAAGVSAGEDASGPEGEPSALDRCRPGG